MNMKAYVNGELVELDPAAAQAVLASQLSPEQDAARVRAESVRAAVASRIVDVASLHTQQNLSSHRIDVMAKRAAGEPISAEDLELETQAVAVAKKIAAIRAAGKAAIANGINVDAIVWPE